MNKFRKIIFWYAVVVSGGLLFLMAYCDGIKPKELIKYVKEDSA